MAVRTRSLEAAPVAARPPRAMVWVLLLAAASAVLLIGLVGTTVILASVTVWPPEIGPAFWVWLLAASGLTIASLGLRSLRWIFLLRRAETRLPIRDAYIGYFAGLSLLFAPFLIGEIAVRAAVQRGRGNVPVSTTVVVNLWERLLDLVALGIIAGTLGIALGRIGPASVGLLAVAVLTLVRPVRGLCLRLASAIGRRTGAMFDRKHAPDFERLAHGRTWLVALAASLGAWVLPGIGFWGLAGVWDQPYDLLQAEYAFASSSGLGGLLLSPGGVLVAGTGLLEALDRGGLLPAAAALSVLGTRLATVGVATVVGGLFLLIHLRSARSTDASHFDAIADAYDVQIPEARRHSLLERKTELMRDVLGGLGSGPRGLDVGCGQGSYVARMRELGFEVCGIDASEGQVHLAAQNVGAAGAVSIGSILEIPAADHSYDFAYVINVLHHLRSIEEQRRAFAELFRVIRPGGVLFVHEINTRNVLFRFYMGYVFPSLNCIDEGVERWLLPNRMAVYTDVPVLDIRYFTFLPDFLPARLVRLLAPIEKVLEASRLRIYSAHYMAVLQNASAPVEDDRACGHADAAAMKRRGEASASVRAGGGAPAPVKK